MSTSTLLATDTSTKGDWVGVYGADGGEVPGDAHSYPAYVTVTQAGFNLYGSYHPATSPQPILWSNHAARNGYVWFGDPFTLQLSFGDADPHQVALYYFADGNSRVETVEIRDADSSDTLLESHSFNNAGGAGGFASSPFWYVFQFTGNIKVKHINNTGPNAVLSAFMFDSPAPSSPTRLSRVFTGYPGFNRAFTGF